MAAQTQLENLVNRLEKVADRLEKVSIKGGGSGGHTAIEDVPEFVEEFDKYLQGTFGTFMKLAGEVGEDVKKQADLVEKAFKSQQQFLVVAGKHSTPAQADLAALLKPTSEAISAVQEFREKNRKSKQFNHLSLVSEGIPALGWVAVSPKPGNYVKDMVESAQFYVNRVIKDHKESNPKHVEWARSFLKVLNDLFDYIKEYHAIGVFWNREGTPAKADALKASPSAAPAPPAAGPPPPPPPGAGPPPPPPPAAAPASGGGDSGDGSRSALFAQLNQGTDITKGLKKVTKDMQTHKNPNLRASNVVPAKSTGATITAPKPFKPGAPVKKPPVFELQNKKWIVEYQEGRKDLVISETNRNQTVYVFKCNNTVLQIKGKINSVTLDSCSKSAIVVEDLVSTCEFVNCKSVQAQINGVVPTVSIDKTDGCQIYLNKDTLSADIITAKSSEMNVLVPNEAGEFVEYPLPEQFKSKWTGSAFKTEVLDIAG